MKNYTITVNGNVYDVTVEEGNSSGPALASAPAPTPAPRTMPQPVVAAAPKKAAVPVSNEGSVKISAPMPGKILAVKASVGQAVKKGDTLLILEAMKMENDIVAPSDGTVVSINVAAGDAVEPGATLATLN